MSIKIAQTGFRPKVPRYLPVEAPEFAKKRATARKALAAMDAPSDKKYSNWQRWQLDDIFDLPIGGMAPTFAIDQPDFATGYKTIAAPLSATIPTWPDHVRGYLMGEALPPDYHYFSALSGALYADGAVIVVPDGVMAEITVDFTAEPGKLNAFRSIIIVGKGAQATVIERMTCAQGQSLSTTSGAASSRVASDTAPTPVPFRDASDAMPPPMSSRAQSRDPFPRMRDSSASPGPSPGSGRNDKQEETIVVHGIEAYVSEGGSLKYYAAQELDQDSRHFAIYRSRQDRDATLDWLIGSFGAKHVQVHVESGLAAEGAESNVQALYAGGAGQHFDQHLEANHLVGHTTSNTYARGIVRGGAKAVYRGMITIKPGAHGSSADQNGHAMLLDNASHVDAIPGLQIDADDVVAGHGATVGQIDDEQLFYLQARGLPEDEARQLLIKGFFEDILKQIENRNVRDQFWRAVKEKLQV